MKQHSEPSAVRDCSRDWTRNGERVGFVPTMGALHAGHMSLIDAARRAGADRVVVSIFVNPTQFEAHEDLDTYPQTLSADSEQLSNAKVDLLFTPTAEVMYPSLSQTTVALSELPNRLCGLSRPNHFSGVSTVVNCLFNIVEPAVAVFGEKDFQQLQVIRQMVRDLHMAIDIVGAPIVRDPDGLALSSRNAYLDSTARQRATSLSKALKRACELFGAGHKETSVLIETMAEICVSAGATLDYIACVNPETLLPVQTATESTRALIAAHFGKTRLIDNCALSGVVSG